jgi:hypothetical protein
MIDEHLDPIDEHLDRGLAAALNVDHSPEFLARVRERVARDERPRAWTLRWPLGAAAAVVAALLLVLVTSSTRERPGNRALGAPTATRAARGGAAIPAVSETAAPRTATVDDSRRALPTEYPRTTPGDVERVRATAAERAPAAASERHEPAVLVSDNEVRAFEKLLALSRRPDVDLTLPDVAPAIDELALIAIVPIEIPPQPPIERLEGGLE